MIPRNTSTRIRLLAVILSTSAGICVAAEDWPEFRGARGDGHVGRAKLPTSWSESSNVAWKVALPGRGWSTPVIADGRIWMTTATDDGKDLSVLCVNQDDGILLHKKRIYAVPRPATRNKMNSYASPSPVLLKGRVYVYYGTYGVACLDAKTGDKVWSRTDVELDHQEGPGSSLIRYKNQLIFHCDGRDVQFLISLDANTGKTLWKVKRSLDLSHVGDFARKAFTTPFIAKSDTGDRLISPAAQGCYCYEPASGREIWRTKYKGFSAVPRPVVSGKLAIIVDGFSQPKIYAFDFTGKGDISADSVKWVYSQNGPSTPSPILAAGNLHFVTDKGGILSSINATNGEFRWRTRLGGNFCASPIAANGLLYFCDREGSTSVIKPGDKADVIAVNKLAEGLMASPAVSGDDLFLRTPSYLYRISDRSTAAGR